MHENGVFLVPVQYTHAHTGCTWHNIMCRDVPTIIWSFQLYTYNYYLSYIYKECH